MMSSSISSGLEPASGRVARLACGECVCGECVCGGVRMWGECVCGGVRMWGECVCGGVRMWGMRDITFVKGWFFFTRTHTFLREHKKVWAT